MRTFAGLPGAEIVIEGLRDLDRGVVSIPSMLVAVASPRLRRLGLTIPDHEPNPEHRLYALLHDEYGDAAHGRYNALVRRLVSFERALECAG